MPPTTPPTAGTAIPGAIALLADADAEAEAEAEAEADLEALPVMEPVMEPDMEPDMEVAKAEAELSAALTLLAALLKLLCAAVTEEPAAPVTLAVATTEEREAWTELRPDACEARTEVALFTAEAPLRLVRAAMEEPMLEAAEEPAMRRELAAEGTAGVVWAATRAMRGVRKMTGRILVVGGLA
ncbi:hypothetical protein LTR28_000287 [Elasticomyces elasticus]|nr:hypothetical protein LTR28_000287 [Elasticomyces elasticus]